MSQYFPKPYEPFGGDINVKVDLSNYATKADIKTISHVDTTGFVLKSMIKKTDYNTKITEIEGKIPDISNLATKAALTSVENKIPSVNYLVKKTDYNTKITEIENKLNNHNHDKYIDNSEFNKLAVDVFNARTAQANLITKTDFDAKLLSLSKKNNQNKTKQFTC